MRCTKCGKMDMDMYYCNDDIASCLECYNYDLEKKGFEAGIKKALGIVSDAYKEHERECPEEIMGWIESELNKLLEDKHI